MISRVDRLAVFPQDVSLAAGVQKKVMCRGLCSSAGKDGRRLESSMYVYASEEKLEDLSRDSL